MNSKKMQICTSILVLVLFSVFSSLEAELQVGFYNYSCPSAEKIVREEVALAFATNPGIAPGLVRLHFHDCFVRGCDGSVLIDSTTNNTAEKDSPANNPSLRGFEVIDNAKKRIEARCKKTVSCADILAFAARDSVKITQGLFYSVPSGRRDGRISLTADAFPNLPGPQLHLNLLNTSFLSKGLSLDDMVVLSGAHTIGRSHCTTLTQVDNRLYNFSGTNGPDPTLNSTYAAQLQQACPQASTDTTTVVPMDPDTPLKTDTRYYANILANKGLFTSDHALLTDPTTASSVKRFAKDKLFWLNKFTAAMVKMGKIQVLEGTDGEIRLNCRVIN
ncbi:peroxidase 5-like [Silene latifolia]|uniref:peroxidase 5-like n=1 Tax=Silene latifolia TaxID=37657 RepID=UPI003D76C156